MNLCPKCGKEWRPCACWREQHEGEPITVIPSESEHTIFLFLNGKGYLPTVDTPWTGPWPSAAVNVTTSADTFSTDDYNGDWIH